MDVFYNKNGDPWSRGGKGQLLTAFTVNQTFLWEGQEILIPAVYVGEAGVALDVCARIPTEDMISFLKKWDKKRRLSLKTQEELEQFEAENPSCQDFFADMSIVGTSAQEESLTCRMSSSLMWYPLSLFEEGEWKNDAIADRQLSVYQCDKASCWHFGRIVYDWKTEPVLCPESILLTFRARTVSVTVEHFTTDLTCDGETIKAVHPQTGQEYTVTILGCKQVRHSFADIGKEGVIYPECCLSLSYRISPELSQELVSVRDCEESDQPKLADNIPKGIKKHCRSSAVILGDPGSAPDRRMAFSSLHFEPVTKARWRILFR